MNSTCKKEVYYIESVPNSTKTTSSKNARRYGTPKSVVN